MERQNKRPKRQRHRMEQIRDAAGIHGKGLELLKIIHRIDSSAIPCNLWMRSFR